jgi:AAA+ superfamily predicted ATPase
MECVAASGPGSALRRGALLTLTGTGPWSTTELALAPSVIWALGGDPTPDPDLPPGAWVAEGTATAGGPVPDLLLVSGPDRVRRRAVAMQARPASGFLVVAAPTDEVGWAAVVREATLLGTAVVVELELGLPAEGRRWIERATHLTWTLTSTHELPLSELPDRPRTELTAADTPVTDEEWHAALGADVARRHHLTPVQLEQVRTALPAVDGDLDRAVRRLLAGPMGRLAQRIQPTKTWDDLVLSAPKAEQLRNVVARYRHATTVYDQWGVTTASGRGVVSLFTGPSGTGKTPAAEVIAHTLELDLYRLELSSVVSKYIGETEQNLERLFEAASAGEAVLFFDEADSLFGKRSEVKDGRDRYANLEVSYLLQRLERYDGVVVLATNLPGNIDEAFLRRFHEVVDFTAPGPDERRTIWERHLADGQLPTRDLDLDRLQRFEITGGLIRNVVVGAAFRAAEEQGPLSMNHLLNTLATELRKLGRMTRPEDFATHD